MFSNKMTLLSLCTLILSQCKPTTETSDVLSKKRANEAAPVEMSCVLDKQLAQMIIMGFRGMDVKDSDPLAESIKKYQIGGVIFFTKMLDIFNILRNWAWTFFAIFEAQSR